jgi:hypothetical protein
VSFTALLNKVIAVSGRTKTGTDGGGQPIYTIGLKGTVLGRVDPRGGRGRDAAQVINGPDLNPVISDYLAITEMPVGFTVSPRDEISILTDDFEVISVDPLDGRVSAHHLEIALRKVAA